MRGVVAVVALLTGALVLDRAVLRSDVPGRAVALPDKSQVRGTASSIGRVVYPDGHLPRLSLPNGQSRPVRSLLKVPGRLRFGDYLWNDTGIPPGPVWVRIDLARQILSVFRGADEIGTAVILYGADGKPTPTGIFPVLEKAVHHRSTLYAAEMPYMLRLTGDGVAIHASSVRERSATHGCIGVPAAFARKLFGAIERGDRVAIIGRSVPT